MYTIFSVETLKEHSEDQGVDAKIFERILCKYVGKMWAGCIWLRIGTTGCPL